MVAVNSEMVALGSRRPAVAAVDELLTGAPVAVVMFLSNHCPYVRHIGRELGLITQRLAAKGVGCVGIMSNDVVAYPDDAPDKMVVTARSYGWDFPYLFDEHQQIAIAYRAACTPDFFVYDAGGRLAYRGQFDGARPGNDTPVTGRDLLAAVNALLAGATPGPDQVPSMGCSIKWRAGNAPEWAP